MVAMKSLRAHGIGVGFKSQHFADIIQSQPPVGFFEVHAENYMGDGGLPHFWLRRLSEDYALSVHGVGLSIGGADDLDTEHLDHLKNVVNRYQPALVSEHLAWSSHQGRYYNYLLALPYTSETLARVTAHIDQVQTVLGRTILLENPSTYIQFDASTMHEADFISQVIQQTGCGLLLDINNVYITTFNHGLDATYYLNRLPLDRVWEIHLAGHAESMVGNGTPVLIDAHDRGVADPVLRLFESVLPPLKDVPILLEWDNDVPDWKILLSEAKRIEMICTGMTVSGTRHVA